MAGLMEGELNAKYRERWAFSRERYYSSLIERFKGDAKEICTLERTKAHGFGYVNDGFCEGNGRTNAQSENDERRLGVLASLELVVPVIEHLHHGTDQACSQH